MESEAKIGNAVGEDKVLKLPYFLKRRQQKQ